MQAGSLLPWASNVGSPQPHRLHSSSPPSLHHSQPQQPLHPRRRNPWSPPLRIRAPCLLSMTHRGHHVTAANFWAGRLEEGGVLLIIPMYFPCIRSRTFKGRCDHGLNKYSRASTPSKVREACTVLVLPTTRQTGAQGAQRRGERCWKIGREGGRSQRQVGQKRKEDSFRLCRAKSLGQRRSRRGQERWASGCKKNWSDGVEDSGADVFVSPSTCLASLQLELDSTLMRTVPRSCVQLVKDRLEISS